MVIDGVGQEIVLTPTHKLDRVRTYFQGVLAIEPTRALVAQSFLLSGLSAQVNVKNPAIDQLQVYLLRSDVRVIQRNFGMIIPPDDGEGKEEALAECCVPG
jgi:hypothetical protein